MTTSLFKIFATNIFSFNGMTDSIKKGWKGIIKAILLGLLFLYVVVVFIGMYSMIMFSIYSSLKDAGTTNLMPVISMIAAFCVIFFFGISSVATNYFTGNGEEQFLSMPVTPAQFFGAKFGVSVISDAFIGFGFFAISSGIYGYNEHLLTKPLFYVGTLVSAAAISLIAIAFIYFLLIILLYFVPALRKKSILTGVASVFIIAFAACYGFINSQFGSKMGTAVATGDMGQMAEIANPIVSYFRNMDSALSFLKFISNALNGHVVPILILVVVSAAIIFVYIPLMGKLYVKTLNGFTDIKTKKLSAEKAEETIKEIKINSVFKAFYLRDLRTVLREPTFFANGPLMIILLPVIMTVSIVFSLFVQGGESFNELKNVLTEALGKLSPEDFTKVKFYIVLIAAAVANFMGNSTSIASSSFSREGKSLYDLKAMPVTNLMLAKVKFWHAFTYVLVTDVIIVVYLFIANLILGAPFELSVLLGIFIMIIVINTAVSLPIVIFDMFMDTVNPKLNWENPIAAFKQNMNSIIAVFATMIIDGLFVILGVFVLPKSLVGLIILAVIFVIIGAPVGVAYFKYAEKRITKM